MTENQSLKTNPEVQEIPVTCINFKCFNAVKVKNSVIGDTPGDFFCSESCKEEYYNDGRV
jgi:hypothetical protein